MIRFQGGTGSDSRGGCIIVGGKDNASFSAEVFSEFLYIVSSGPLSHSSSRYNPWGVSLTTFKWLILQSSIIFILITLLSYFQYFSLRSSKPLNKAGVKCKKQLHFIFSCYIILCVAQISNCIVLSPSGKALDSDSSIRGFESLKPSSTGVTRFFYRIFCR